MASFFFNSRATYVQPPTVTFDRKEKKRLLTIGLNFFSVNTTWFYLFLTVQESLISFRFKHVFPFFWLIFSFIQKKFKSVVKDFFLVFVYFAQLRLQSAAERGLLEIKKKVIYNQWTIWSLDPPSKVEFYFRTLWFFVLNSLTEQKFLFTKIKAILF